MRFSRSRYVILCQQSLVTAAVLAVGVSAAGIKTLDIEPGPSQLAGPRAGAMSVPNQSAPGYIPSPTDRPARQAPAKPQQKVPAPPPAPASPAPAESAPVTPKVREVAVTEVTQSSASAPARKDSDPAAPGKADKGAATEGARQQPRKGAAPATAQGESGIVAQSMPEKVNGYATVGVTWSPEASYSDEQITIEVRTEEDGTWSRWAPVEYHDDHGADSDEGEQRPGTDALVIGEVDRVQMRAETSDGSVPADLKLAVIDPGTGKMQAETPAIDTASLSSATFTSEESDEEGEDDTVALSAMKQAPKPYIYSRAQWGANERLREQSNPSYGTIRTGFVHHTVNANNYTQAQVPSLLRGIYAYHTQSRGWRDIGYNFLVDRFGRIWEGRWGGVNRAVVGAHTSGYNEVSFAMSAIGNFDIASAPQAVLNAYARLMAWKLSMYNIRADASKIWVKNKYFRAINGHRDAGSTACPGRYLYAKLATIRSAAQALQNKAQAVTPAPSPTPAPTPSPTPSPSPSPSPAPAPAPADPPYTGSSRSDARCYPASISKRAYRYTSASTRTPLLVPLQCLLKQQRLYPYAVTGKWNKQTSTAVHAFQARVRHPRLNAFTRADWTALTTAGNSGRVLKRGSRGADVVMLQRGLNAALDRKLPVTGTYNARTARVVGVYQRRVGITRTRVVHTLTWTALEAGRR